MEDNPFGLLSKVTTSKRFLLEKLNNKFHGHQADSGLLALLSTLLVVATDMTIHFGRMQDSKESTEVLSLMDPFINGKLITEDALSLRCSLSSDRGPFEMMK